MAGYDVTRLYTLLLNTGLQIRDNPLHQVIHGLIGALGIVNKQVNTIIVSGSSSSSSAPSSGSTAVIINEDFAAIDGIDGVDGLSIQGPQGNQGLQGLPGIDGIDGIDGLDSFILSSSGNSGVDPTWTVAVPLTGGTVVMNIGQQRITLNPAGSLLVLTVTLPAGPVNNQIAGMAFTQVITGLTINAPGGATVVAPATSAAVDSTFRFIYQTSSTSWFPIS